MFRYVFNKLKKFYHFSAKSYASIIVQHPVACISSYFLLLLVCCLGLLQTKLITDNESLTIVRNSQVLADKRQIDRIFPFNQSDSYFQHHLTDLGYFFEIMVKLKHADLRNFPPFNKEKLIEASKSDKQVSNDYVNFKNKTLLDEYNKLFDEIITLEIHDTISDLNNNTVTLQNKSYSYKNNLCAKRLSKCAIEGGVARAPSFQKAFLNNQVSFDIDDVMQVYMDVEAVDGTGMSYLFSNHRKLSYSDKTNKCVIEGVFLIRNRFDLLSRTENEKRLAVKFMHRFVDYMRKIEETKQFPHFDISFQTSHTTQTEIEYYTKFDLPLIGLSCLLFWLLFIVSMIFDLNFLNILKCKSYFKSFEWSNVWLNKCGLLFLSTIFQLFMTIISSIGLISLLGIQINQLLLTILFILMVNMCHQSLLFYRNAKQAIRVQFNANQNEQDIIQLKPFLCNEFAECSLSNDSRVANKNNQNENYSNTNIVRVVTSICRQILVPNFYTLVSTVLTYFLIGMTSSFDSIRVYCFFLIICLMVNYFGLLAFFIPCMILNFKRLRKNKNFLLCCIKHSKSSSNLRRPHKTYKHESKELLEANNEQTSKIETLSEESMNDSNSKNLVNSNKFGEENSEKTSENHTAKTSMSAIGNSPRCRKMTNRRKTAFDLIFSTKIRLFIVILFVFYFVFNIFVCVFMSKVDLPISKLLPSQSYLSKHLKFHRNYFKLGPIVTLNFIKPLNYTEERTLSKIEMLKSDIKRLKGMSKFEMNWLNATITEIDTNKQFDQSCEKPFSDDCFYKYLQNVKEQQQFEADIQVYKNEMTNEYTINASRFFFQFEKFDGSFREAELMMAIKTLVEEKYKFNKDTAIVFSSLFIYLEQLIEIFPAFLSVVLLSIDCLFFGNLLLLFDLRSIFLSILIVFSSFLSIFSWLFLFNISLNTVTIFEFLMVPAILFEFFHYFSYLFLYNNRSSSIVKIQLLEKFNSNVQDAESQNECFDHQKERLRCLRITLQKCSASSTLLINCLISFFVMIFCSTYLFRTLFVILFSTIFTITIHLFLFYPVLLSYLGTCWMPSTKEEKSITKRNKTFSDN